LRVTYHETQAEQAVDQVCLPTLDQLPQRNVQRSRGGLAFKAHRLLYHSTRGLRVIKKKRGCIPRNEGGASRGPGVPPHSQDSVLHIICVSCITIIIIHSGYGTDHETETQQAVDQVCLSTLDQLPEPPGRADHDRGVPRKLPDPRKLTREGLN